MSLNLTFLGWPIELDIKVMLALTPFTEVTSVNLGSFSKLNPLEVIFTFAIDPLIADADLVLNVSLSHIDWSYVRTEGIFAGEILNVVVFPTPVTPKTL